MTKTMSSKAKPPPKQASLNSFFKAKNGDPLKPPKRKDAPDISKFMVSKKEKSKDTKEQKHINNNDDDNANVEKKKPQDTKTIDIPDTPQTAAGGSSDEDETETAMSDKAVSSNTTKSSNDRRKNDDEKDDNNKKQTSVSNDEAATSKKKRVKRSSIQESKRSEEEDSSKPSSTTEEEVANMTTSTTKRSKRSSIQESKQCEIEDQVTMEKKADSSSSTTKNAKKENPPSKKRAKRSSIQESKMAEKEDHSSSTSLSKTSQTKNASSGTTEEEVLTKKTNGNSSKKRRTIMEDSDEEEEEDSPMDNKNDTEMSSIVDASASKKKENNTEARTEKKATSTNGFFEKKTTKPEATTTKEKRNTKRRTVLEDSDDDEVLQKTKKVDSDFEDKEEANDDDDDVLSDENDGDTGDDDDDDDDDNKKLSTLVSKNGKKATTKKSINDVLKHSTKKPTTKKATGSGVVKKAESMAKGMKSNEALLDKGTFPYLWDKGSDVPYLALCEIFTSIEAISGRLDIQQLLTELFRQCILLMPEENGTTKSTTTSSKGNNTNTSTKNNNDLLNLIYLASNTVAPPYECVELGIGDAILIKAIGESYGTNASMIKQRYDKAGDLGSVAASAKGMQRTLSFGMKPKPLMAREVLTVFRQIATTSGSQSQKWKVDKIKGLLVRAKGPEAKYVIRGLQGKLRIGLAQTTVLASLAHALVLSPPPKTQMSSNDELKKIIHGETEEEYPDTSRKLCNPKTPLDEKLDCAVQIVKKSFSELPSFDALMEAALTAPLWEFFRTCTLKPGIPVEPMLAKPTKSVLEVLKRLNSLKFTCEYKYDGERAQIHMMSTTDEGPDGTLSNTKTTTKVFSRNMLETSEKYPEVPLYVKEACCDDKVTSYIMDTEVVAYNRQTGHFVPFQILSTRKKQEETAETAKVQIIVQAFDLMYLNGKSLLNKTLQERRELLHSHFQVVEGKFRFAISKDFQEDGETNEIEEFLDAAIKNKCEGLMVKTLEVNANYEPSRRSLNWLKLKKDYLEGLGDSVDLVPIGAFVGKGKRTGVYGAYLLACYDVDTEEYQSVCKIGTGFSDANLVSLAEGLNKHIIPEKSSQYNVSETLQCDVWFDAVQVWEVKAADLSKSSTHKGAIDKTGETGRGIGLRFPRFERLREDKKPEQATTSDQILDMYYNQDTVQGHDDAPGGGGGGDDDDDGI